MGFEKELEEKLYFGNAMNWLNIVQ
jgi:hypothetical protein